MPKVSSSLSSPKQYPCEVCGKVLGRNAELTRHAKTHAADLEDLKIQCPYAGCNYRTLQKSNVETHIVARHLKEKPHKCSLDDCTKAYADPAALIRHEKIHGIYRNGKDKARVNAKVIRSTKPYSRPDIKREASPEVTLNLNVNSTSPSPSPSPSPSSPSPSSSQASESVASSLSPITCIDDNNSPSPISIDIFEDLFPSLSFPVDYSCDNVISNNNGSASTSTSTLTYTPSSSEYYLNTNQTVPSFPPSPIFSNGNIYNNNNNNTAQLPFLPLLSTTSTPPTFNTNISEWDGSGFDNNNALNIPFLPDLSSFFDAPSPSPSPYCYSPSESSSMYSTPAFGAEYNFDIPVLEFNFDDI